MFPLAQHANSSDRVRRNTTICAQLNKPLKSVFKVCLKDTRFKNRGVFNLQFTSAGLLSSLLDNGFSVGGKTIGGGSILCYVPNFGVEFMLRMFA